MNRKFARTTPGRSKLVRTTVAALSATAVGVTIGAVSLGGQASAHEHATTTHYVLRDGQFGMSDLGKPGEGLGDMLVATQPVTHNGRRVGRLHDVAVAVDAKRGLFQANGSLVLSGGTIEFAGLVSQTPHFTMAITGGTGKYQGADGKVSFDFPGSRQLLSVSLRH